MEEKESKVNYFVYALVFVAILIIATVAVTYAYFKVNTDFDTNLGGASATLECIDMTLSDNNTTLGLSHNYPITDTLAMQSGSVTPLEVTVTNNCSNDVKYSLALSTLALASNQSNYIEDGKIRYKIVKNDADHKGIDYLDSMTKIDPSSKLYNDLTGVDGELATKYENYVLKQIYSVDDLVTLGVNSSNTYDIYMWVDYYEGDAQMYESNDAVHNEAFDGTTEGKKFAAALSLSFNTGEPNEELTPIGEYIQNANPAGYNTTMEGGLYRFQGTTADNHICFGTSDKATCTGNTQAYMYRIIGIDSNGQLKLIKKEAFNTAYYWHNTYFTDTSWPNSDLFKGLNGISGGKYSNLFIGNSTYMPSGWSNKIVDYNWKYGDNQQFDITASDFYSIENAWIDEVNAKIGLMYAHDYAYGMSGGNNCSSSGAYTTCKTSWLHLSNNDSTIPNPYEWIMSRYCDPFNDYYPWMVRSEGYYSTDMESNSRSVRPVFYLKSSVNFIGGTGTASDPFIIK